MTLLNPSKAPVAHVEILPASSIAAEATSVPAGTNGRPRIQITTWSPGEETMDGIGNGEDSDDWVENNCHSCRYHEEEIEHSANGEDVSTDDGTLTLVGTFYTNSPCPCYDEGVSHVSFPCIEGLDGPSEENDDTDLSTDYLRYKVGLELYADGSAYPYNQFVSQQACTVTYDGLVYVGPKGSAVNTYSPDNHVCWGDNYPGDNLCENEAAYILSEANEDLTSFSTHEADARTCKNSPREEWQEYALPTPDKDDDNGKGLAVAAAGSHASAFLIMATNGARINGSVAAVPIYMYPQVAIDDDTIINVWATDVMPTGKRLLFSLTRDEGGTYLSQLLGAVDQDFNLTKCESVIAPSSEQAEQDNSLLQAC